MIENHKTTSACTVILKYIRKAGITWFSLYSLVMKNILLVFFSNIFI